MFEPKTEPEDEKIDLALTEKVYPIRKRRNPFRDSPEKPKKEIKIEEDDKPSPAAPKHIEVEVLKNLIFAAKRDYDKVQLGLKIVRTNMDSLMDKITRIEKSVK